MKKRLYRISHNPNCDAAGCEVISPIQASGLINSSVDSIYLDHMNLYPIEDAKKLIILCAGKLRPKGILSINLYNILHICKSYTERSITDQELTQYLSNCRCVISVDNAIQMLQELSMDISEINYSNNQFIINIVCQRT